MRTLHLSVCAFFALLATPVVAQVQAYLVDSAADRLYSVDLMSGAATPLASTLNNGLTLPADLSWDEALGELWTVDFAGGEVGTIDVATGVFTPRFQATPANGWQGLAWDPATQLFYLANGSDDAIYTLDPGTGQCALLGSSGAALITCLDVDASGVLWGIEFSAGALVQIDKLSGAATPVVTTAQGFQDLGIDPLTGILYAASSMDGSLHEVDALSGTTVLRGPLGAGVTSPKGFDLVGSTCSGSTAYSDTGCPDSSLTPLLMIADGPPCLGQTIAIGTQLGASVPYFLVMGLSDQVWQGLTLPIDLTFFGAPGCFLYTSDEAILGPLIPGSSLLLPVPRFPLLIGATTYWQGFALDPALTTALPLATSDLLTVTLG